MKKCNAHFPDCAEGFWDGYRDPMADSPWLARWSLGWFIGRRVRLFELTRPFRYVMANGDVITVPAGYRTDGASIPRRQPHHPLATRPHVLGRPDLRPPLVIDFRRILMMTPAITLELDADLLWKIACGLLTGLVFLVGLLVRGTWILTNLLRDIRGELAQIRSQLTAGEKEFKEIRRDFWPRTAMERFAVRLNQENPDLQVPDPHDEEFRD